MHKRGANSVWHGDGATGHGHLTTDSHTLKATPYSFKQRFGDAKGTNPEELIAAAHAGCFNMAFAFGLKGAGFVPDELNTTATATLETVGTPTVTKIHLDVTGKVPGITAAQFKELAEGAKAGCPISRLLKAAEITMDTKLV